MPRESTMGYYTTVEFVGVRLNKARLETFRKYVERYTNDASLDFHWMFKYLYLYTNEHGYLDWNLNEVGRKCLSENCGESPVRIETVDWPLVNQVFLHFGANEEDRFGKWYNLDRLVEWLAGDCEGGQIIVVSQEGDGAVWGWEFNKRCRYRQLVLQPRGHWCKAPRMRLKFPASAHVDDPTRIRVSSAIKNLNHENENPFLILEDAFRPNAFIRTNKMTSESFLVEYAEGDPQRQFRCIDVSEDQVQKLFLAYLGHDETFKTMVEWHKRSPRRSLAGS